MATINCATPRPFPNGAFLRFLCLSTLVTGIGFAPCAQGEGIDGQQKELSKVAEGKYTAAQKRHIADPEDVEAAWQFARACFDRAEYATNNAERAAIAQQGIAPCRELLVRGVQIAPAHYYLGMNLGQLARTKTLGALKIVDEMELAFKMARALEESFDYAGPDRSLGLLYLQAPRVGSIGNRSKARQHLLNAVELAPDYPDNRLNLAEAYLRWKDNHFAKRQLKALDEIWSEARARFTGLDWEASWLDWEARLQRLRKTIEENDETEAARTKI